MNRKPTVRVADLFCGGGGETTGIYRAAATAGLRIDLAAVNHWQTAIDTHRMNFPEARAYCQDLAALNPHDVFHPRDHIDLLWASPECTHHSIARGGRPRSAQQRESPYLILKWLTELPVRRVIIENVPEIATWGPLSMDGQPLESKKGTLFEAFLNNLRAAGYKVDWQCLCAANYGDGTSRTRLFIQAVRGKARILWPEPTHAQYPSLFSEKPWVTARTIIDWSIKGQSIFDRKKPLAPTTMRRIVAGIRRFWGKQAEPFLAAIDHNGSGNDRAYSLDEPLRTITTENRFALVRPFLTPFYGERDGQEPRTHAIDQPIPTIPASGAGKFGVVRPFIIPYYGTAVPDSVDEPLASVTAKDRFALVNGHPCTLDITFRMLQPHELALAQGFPAGFRFAGNKSDQVKQIGNAVPAGTACALALTALAS